MGGSAAIKFQRENSPRVRMAFRLLHTGAVRTLEEAAKLTGTNMHYLSLVRRKSPVMRAYVKELEDKLDAGAVNTSDVIRELGKKGLMTIARMMENGEVKDELRLKAAVDLADRSPETSKTNKLSIEGGLTIQSADVSRLMAALVEGAEVAKEFDKEVASGDYVKVDDGSHLLPAPKDG